MTAPDAPTYSPNTFEVDLDAVANNAREVRRAIGPDRRLFAVLKGNALGFGAVEIAKVVRANGADACALVHLRDGVKLREGGVTGPILLYGGNLGDPGSVALVERYELTVAIVDLASARMHSDNASNRVRCFVEIDTGMERLGVRAESAVEVITEISKLPRLSLDGVFTHLHVDGLYSGAEIASGAPVPAFVDWQFARFKLVLDGLRRAGIAIPVAMAASSPTVRLSPDMNLTGVDTGRLMYGLIPPVPAGVEMNLRPAFGALKSRLIQVKDVVRQDFVEDAGFEIRDGMRIGIIPMGIADGLESLTCGEVLVAGRRVKVIGKFFEHARLDLTDVPDASPGDEVVITGRQGEAEITGDEVIRRNDLHLLGGLGALVGDSVRRVYRQPTTSAMGELAGSIPR